MGDHREIVVDLDVASGEVAEARSALDGLLSSSGWTDEGGTSTDRMHEGQRALVFGAAARARFALLTGGTLVILATREVHGIGDGTTDPACPSCGLRVDAGAAEPALRSWWEGTEPTLTCASCGFRSPMGDWDLRDSVAIGGLAIVLDVAGPAALDPADVAAALAEDLRAATGRRWASTHLHL
ncbi:hypothetical protein GRS96_07435 [Rathayibacter sp. VKM Ac-2803]|uniref:hypothetical protein n=1 Tax=Rathayibacter sp. VKM Ac-2803 TaxID=2609256 RepID=UPI00135ACD54|nr:hypothetical protein [Rathayibacter sp. VKM Ac-2803]MWV49108.1 hypothetical protein [Rathayibacter sp. VKM Ac-2803]